jgi:hypothetical protein
VHVRSAGTVAKIVAAQHACGQICVPVTAFGSNSFVESLFLDRAFLTYVRVNCEQSDIRSLDFALGNRLACRGLVRWPKQKAFSGFRAIQD